MRDLKSPGREAVLTLRYSAMAALMGAWHAGKSVGKNRLKVECGDLASDSATGPTSFQAWPTLFMTPADESGVTGLWSVDIGDGCAERRRTYRGWSRGQSAVFDQ